jgi:signal transduction histidine kinase/CheY-like chemotaxis protein
MKLTDLKIGAQLIIGFGIIIGFIAILGYVSWQQSNKIADQTTKLYDHPLQVRRTLGELKTDILIIHRGNKDLGLTENDKEILVILQDIEKHKASAFKQYEILFTLYLGPRTDIESAYNDFIVWNTIREKNIQLLNDGNIKELIARTKSNGVDGLHVEILLDHIQKIDDFARNKGDEFHLNAVELSTSLNQQLGFLVAFILALTLLLIFVLAQNIRKPLKALSHATKRFKEGDFQARSAYESLNEFGQLSSAFNDMADTVETELNLSTQSSLLSAVMLEEEDAHHFCHTLLGSLLEQTEAQMGAVYLLNDVKTEFELFESMGLDSKEGKSFLASDFEGEFGSVLATKKLKHIKDIPDDSRFTFSTVSGKFIPREIITIPIVTGNETVSVISLATIQSFSPSTIRFIEAILSTLSARMDGILAYQKVIDFSQKLENQNRELETQKKELSSQTNELTEQNIELEMQKRQLNESNKMKTSFLSNMSHELRTPLNSVIALSGVLNRRLAKKIADEEYGYIEVIERNGKQLLSLINDILDLSRIEAGYEEIEISKFKVNGLISEVVEMIEPQANLKNISLQYLAENTNPEIQSDYEKCRHILQNLIANAVKFTEEGGVEVVVEQKDKSIFITVIDTGIGILNKHLPLIFDEFRQADGSNSRKYGGSGLGLAIAQKYTQLLGGRIQVESTYGEGSRFMVELPLQSKIVNETTKNAHVSHQVLAKKTIPYVKPKHTNEKTILLVEDTQAISIQMKDILVPQGYNILEARNGNEALEQITKKIPDAMILDLMMPEVDGFEVLKRVRNQDKTSRLPVIILTSKLVTKEELAFLKHNRIHQLIQKGDVNKEQLLTEVALMMFPEIKEDTHPEKRIAKIPKSGLPVVLIVEDNPDNMLSLKALLNGICEVVEAENGQKGIDLAILHQPSLILMDFALPVMNGTEALGKLREEITTKEIPVIVVSASAMKGDKEDFISSGFDGYISKPIDQEKFIKEIKKWIG